MHVTIDLRTIGELRPILLVRGRFNNIHYGAYRDLDTRLEIILHNRCPQELEEPIIIHEILHSYVTKEKFPIFNINEKKKKNY